VDVAEVVLYIGLAVLALYGRNVILILAAFVGLLVWGLGVADTNLTTGIVIILIAAYFLYRSYELWFGR